MFFELTGEKGRSAVRTLTGGGRKDVLRKGTVDSFLLRVPRSLGALSYVRIWHDNTGFGHFGSWHLNAVLVKDLQTDRSYEFVLNKWLTLDKADGQV